MSLRDCIETAFNDGEISAEERAELSQTYDRFERQYRLEMDPVSAAAQAGRDTFERLKMDAAEKKRRAYLQAAIQNPSPHTRG